MHVFQWKIQWKNRTSLFLNKNFGCLCNYVCIYFIFFSFTDRAPHCLHTVYNVSVIYLVLGVESKCTYLTYGLGLLAVANRGPAQTWALVGPRERTLAAGCPRSSRTPSRFVGTSQT